MTEEENKAIEDYKRVIAMYFKYSDYDLFCSNLMKSGVKGTIKNTMADMVNLIEKLKKENEELKNTNSSIDSSAEILGEVLRKISSKLITMKFELDKQNTKIFRIYHEQINKREWWKDEKFLKELLEEEE